MKLFQDKELGEAFCDLDIAQLRAKELAVSIAPPGFELPCEFEDEENPDIECSFFAPSVTKAFMTCKGFYFT